MKRVHRVMYIWVRGIDFCLCVYDLKKKNILKLFQKRGIFTLLFTAMLIRYCFLWPFHISHLLNLIFLKLNIIIKKGVTGLFFFIATFVDNLFWSTFVTWLATSICLPCCLCRNSLIFIVSHSFFLSRTYLKQF